MYWGGDTIFSDIRATAKKEGGVPLPPPSWTDLSAHFYCCYLCNDVSLWEGRGLYLVNWALPFIMCQSWGEGGDGGSHTGRFSGSCGHTPAFTDCTACLRRGWGQTLCTLKTRKMDSWVTWPWELNRTLTRLLPITTRADIQDRRFPPTIINRNSTYRDALQKTSIKQHLYEKPLLGNVIHPFEDTFSVTSHGDFF